MARGEDGGRAATAWCGQAPGQSCGADGPVRAGVDPAELAPGEWQADVRLVEPGLGVVRRVAKRINSPAIVTDKVRPPDSSWVQPGKLPVSPAMPMVGTHANACELLCTRKVETLVLR